MKVCTVEHEAPGFGFVPVGSLWDDDSPYLTDDNVEFFDDVQIGEREPPASKPARKPRATKED